MNPSINRLQSVPLQYKAEDSTISIDRNKYNDVGGCVFRLFYNGKFVVVKGKSLIGSILNISQALKMFAHREKKNWTAGHLYYHFYDFVLSNPGHKMKAELLMVSDNGYRLLVREQEELNKERENPDCLNNTIEAYVPAYRQETSTYGWINRGQYMNFMKWKKRHGKQRR